MRKIIHLIPYDGIGGVEAAARSMADAPATDFDFQVRFIFPAVKSRKQRAATFNPFQFFRCARQIARLQPDIVVMSLWRAAVVGLLVKFLSPGLKLVLFVHNSRDAHLLDFLFTRWAVSCSEEIWADSEASLERRFSTKPRAPHRVISFLTRRISPGMFKGAKPVFVFWGRLSRQKNVDRALCVFRDLRKSLPDARFIVIGPDGGDLAMLKRRCLQLGISEAVVFTGPLNFEEISRRAAEASFYLQTSRYEGMAMSVVEAMQLGLVPIVTPVGEIASYCRHGHNALVLGDHATLIRSVTHLLGERREYEAIRANAVATWCGRSTYSESILHACHSILKAH